MTPSPAAKSQATSTHFRCAVCKQQKNRSEIFPGTVIRAPITALIQEEVPDWQDDQYICQKDLDRLRNQYVTRSLTQERGELTALETQVLKSLQDLETISEDTNAALDQQRTFGQQVADTVANFGGSWIFILSFFFFLFGWILLNTVVLSGKNIFDPYPYILLNLGLSCLAAIQAPIIMMSQNRQEARDRLRGEHDYRVNLKSELEIRHLNAKMDLLLNHLWMQLLEIQTMQLDSIQEKIHDNKLEKEKT